MIISLRLDKVVALKSFTFLPFIARSALSFRLSGTIAEGIIACKRPIGEVIIVHKVNIIARHSEHYYEVLSRKYYQKR